MKIEVRSDARKDEPTMPVSAVTEMVESELSRFRDRLTRVDVHLSDTNGPKGGTDKRCLLEARPASLSPVAVDATGESEGAALHDALGKLTRLLTSTFDKQADIRNPTSASGLPT